MENGNATPMTGVSGREFIPEKYRAEIEAMEDVVQQVAHIRHWSIEPIALRKARLFRAFDRLVALRVKLRAAKEMATGGEG